MFYVRSSREIKRLEAISRSPVYSFFSSTIDGLANLRASGLDDSCFASFIRVQDKNTEAFITFLAASSWLGFRVNVISAFFLSLTGFVAVASRDSAQAYLVGLSVTYALTLSGAFQWVISQSAQAEVYSKPAFLFTSFVFFSCFLS